jgi:hypothetical protein
MTPEGELLVKTGRMDPRNFAMQLNQADTTQKHVEMAQALFDLAMRMSGANDPAMGAPIPEKRTLGEVQSIMAASSQRLAIWARLLDIEALEPFVRRSISNRQQFTSQGQWVRITGDLAKMEETRGMQRLLVDKFALQGDFDYVGNSGLLPSDPQKQADLYLKALEIAGGLPDVVQPGFDGRRLSLREVFNEAFRAAGFRNIDQFYEAVPQPGMPGGPPQVMGDQAIAQQVSAGNMVPVEQAMLPPAGGMVQ